MFIEQAADILVYLHIPLGQLAFYIFIYSLLRRLTYAPYTYDGTRV
jgi:hypothetical protein